MKKVFPVTVIALFFLALSAFTFGPGSGAIFSSTTLTASGSATSAAFTIPVGTTQVGAFVVLTGSTSTRLKLQGCMETGSAECIGDNITILNADTNSNSEAGTITYNHHMGDNASSATSAITANTVTNTRARSSIFLSDNMSSTGGTGSDGKFFFSIPIANFPPAASYKIKATDVSAVAGTITMEIFTR